MGFARTAWAVVWKDLLVERRSKEGMNALVFFAVLLLFLFAFALGTDPARLRAVLPGLLWIAFLLAGLLGLGRAFLVERENDCLEGLVLAPGDKGAVYLGKLGATVALMLAMEAAFFLAVGVFYNIDLWTALPRLFLVAFLGTVGFAALGTLFAAMTLQLRAREVLFPLLLLPPVVPVLLAAVQLTEAALDGAPWGAVGPWVSLLIGFDVIFVVAGLLTFEFVLET